tara:strand:+ start:4611 stop:5804 length:1194 start_codon:yes stop_codon:yes gene_type:complete
MSDNVDFSSAEPTGAIISQFYIALEKCFEMDVNECVYIERDGDVSLENNSKAENGVQIEYKEYSDMDNLTNSHTNFWNTLNNWIKPGFDQNKYKYLVLATTQDIGNNSSLLEWNESNKKERIIILRDIFKTAKTRYSEKIKKSIKEGKEKPKETKSFKLMNEVFQDFSKVELIIEKIIIDSGKINRDKLAIKLANVNLKSIPEKKREQVLNSLLGFVIKNEEYNIGWEINYQSFSQEFQDLTERYNNDSKHFPYHKNLRTVSSDKIIETSKYSFVKKIEEIEYDSVIIKSVKDYWFTLNTIELEFKKRTQKMNSMTIYKDELIDKYSGFYESMSRKCKSDEVIEKSQDFYDSIFEKDTPNFDVFNNTPQIFKNGMYHILADDENENISWKLKIKKNE